METGQQGQRRERLREQLRELMADAIDLVDESGIHAPETENTCLLALIHAHPLNRIANALEALERIVTSVDWSTVATTTAPQEPPTSDHDTLVMGTSQERHTGPSVAPQGAQEAPSGGELQTLGISGLLNLHLSKPPKPFPQGGTTPGRFIVFEGIDGSGKTTQLLRLAEWLPSSGLMPSGAQLHVTHEPGGTALGQSLRQLLLHPPVGIAPCSTAELLLYAADRAQHVENVIRPALEAGNWVLCDRFTGSTVAYQRYGRRLSRDVITELERIATGGLQPDLTLWLDLPFEESLRRRRNRFADRIEATGEEFLRRVEGGFAVLSLLREWHRVDATQSIPNVAKDCSHLVRKLLQRDGHS